MTLSDTINRMIERALLSSYIVSPRFDDYKITVVEQVENPDLEAEIKGMIQDDVIAGEQPQQQMQRQHHQQAAAALHQRTRKIKNTKPKGRIL